MGTKYKLNEHFFKTGSRNSAYILGFIYADGSLENSPYIRGKYIRSTSIDRSLIEKIKVSLGSSHKIVIIPSSGCGKEKYTPRIGSYKVYNDLENLGLHPRKSLDMEFPRVPYRFLSDFIRGYFDGDGCIAFERMKNRPHNRLRAVFTSGSKSFLSSLSNVLKNRCLGELGHIYDSHRSYQLIYNSLAALKVLEFVYNKVEERRLLCLDRKYNKYRSLIVDPETFGCSNLFDKQSKVWN